MYTSEKTVSPVRLVETLSWRTGKRAKGPKVPAPHRLGLEFDSGGLVDRLSQRKRYVEMIDANVSSKGPGRTSPNDTGHDYTKIVRTLSGLSGYVDGVGRVFTGASNAYVPTPVPVLTSGSGARPNGASPVMFDQRRINAALVDMAPQPMLPIGETIVELLSGDLPGMLKSFNKNLGAFQRLQTAGSDYLSVQFAWTPLVKDAIKVIETLMAADHVLYGQKFRRSREIRTERRTHSWTGNNATYTRGLHSPSAGGVYYPPGQSFDWTHHMSHRINARFNNGARPTRKQLGFYDRAMELLFHLGLDDPALGWNVTRFSWLTDWAVDIGSSLQIAANFSQQTGRYPMDYATLSTKSESVTITYPRGPREYYHRGSHLCTIVPSTATCFAFNRQSLSPFRPGVTLSRLTGYQYSILVALGLAKTR